MSEVNKLDETGCPFDPNQYQVNDDNINVPAGTFAWALSLVYLGKQVYRSDWNAPKEHMRLSHESEANNGEGGGNPYIEKSDKALHVTADGVTYYIGISGSFTQATQADGNTYYSLYYRDYNYSQIQPLITILKQTGQTKRFELSWK